MYKKQLIALLIFTSINLLFIEGLYYYFPYTGLGGLVIQPMTFFISIFQTVVISIIKLRTIYIYFILIVFGFLALSYFFPQDYGHSPLERLIKVMFR